MHVKFMPEKHIERAASGLLFAYGQRFGAVAAPPVPAEEIIECHFGLSLGFDDLRTRLKDAGVLGATWIEDKKVLIDQSLDPTTNPRIEGRYRFTVAHEAGHWVLHRHQLVEVRGAPLFDGTPAPSVICRNTGKKPPIELQADYFAGYLLMPEEMVRSAWTEVTGSVTPYVAEDELQQLRERYNLADDEQATVEIAKRMAGVFRVSGQAMQIRLLALHLVLPKRPPPSLFD
jgi:hypothetical protein